MTGAGCNGISSSALVQRLLSICGRELDLKFMDLVPLGVGSPALRYGEKLLQASAGGHRLRCVHGGIIPWPSALAVPFAAVNIALIGQGCLDRSLPGR